MNRKLEFNAWDKKFNVMLEGVGVMDEKNIIVTDWVARDAYGDRWDDRCEAGLEDAGHEHFCLTDDIDILQYAGFKDRNGAMLFDGDIVKEDLAQDGQWRSTGVIEFYEGSFGSRNEHDRFRIPALFSGKAIEGMNINYYLKVGNKYQHPNLLPQLTNLLWKEKTL